MQNASFNATANDTIEQSPDELLAAVSADLTVSLIHEVVISAFDPYVVSLSSFASFGSKGTELQMRATENLRDRLCGLGWEKSDIEQVPCVISRPDSVRIACTTDGGPSIGISYPAKPIMREKGNGTIRLAGHKGNNTAPFPGFETYLQNDELEKLDDLGFYYLLMYLDEIHQEIRLELSAPVLDEKGANLGWHDRIILPSISISNEPPVDTKSVPAPDIEVVRKVS